MLEAPAKIYARFVLFVAGDNRQSAPLTQALAAFCDDHTSTGLCQIIDVIDRPDAAEHYGIVATPTLVRLSPEPRRRFIGMPEAASVEDFLRV
ncbi:MAG TPA: circadian clock KaiB family protein [Methylomirabilota bacterium]|nr:circadian clock KaiB family protein [Methylomirabilota bacterium]